MFALVALLLLVAPLPAVAADAAPPPERVLRSDPKDPLDLLRSGPTEALQPLSTDQHRWLKPRRGRLSPNPYGQTDFTAYSLELGEVKIGVASLTVGLLPRTQVGTVPTLNALGIYNAHAKINLFRFRGFDLAVRGAGHHLPLGRFAGHYIESGAYISQVLHDKLSVHGGASYTSMGARGVPDFGRVSPLITMATGDLSAYNPPPDFFGPKPPALRAEAITARVAVDLRFNRRDSLVLQAWTMVGARVTTDLGENLVLSEVLPPIAGLNEALSYEGRPKVTETYIASLAYQAHYKQVDLRVGIGASAVPYAWLLQSTELSYRFGGKTRRDERLMRRGWRKNRRDVGPPQGPVKPPPLP